MSVQCATSRTPNREQMLRRIIDIRAARLRVAVFTALRHHRFVSQFLTKAAFLSALAGFSLPAAGYHVYVTNERSGDVTVINGSDFSVAATIPVGKRPRGIHVSPDGRLVYIALSGTPIEAPPQIDAHGNPIFEKKKGGDDDENADKSADGIGVVVTPSGSWPTGMMCSSFPEAILITLAVFVSSLEM